jgi:hypothetical protein
MTLVAQFERLKAALADRYWLTRNWVPGEAHQARMACGAEGGLRALSTAGARVSSLGGLPRQYPGNPRCLGAVMRLSVVFAPGASLLGPILGMLRSRHLEICRRTGRRAAVNDVR